MKLPNFEQAHIREEKLTKYLLNLTHSDGASKAKFLIRRGFESDSPEALKAALLNHALNGEVVEIEQNPFGTKYILHGELACPNGAMASIRTVWIIEDKKDFPELVTAYPL